MCATFPLSGPHKAREVISFDEALKLNICKKIQVIETVDTTKETKTSSRARGSVKSDFTEKIIEYFLIENSLADAAIYFDIPYQKVRYELEKIKKSGYNLQRYEFKQGKKNKTKTLQTS